MSPKATGMSNQKVSAAFTAVIEKIGRDNLSEILMNWNDSELNEDGNKIIMYPGRDRQWSRGKDGGKVTVSKREFFTWLYSDEPFDEKRLDQSAEWISKIEETKRAAGF